MRSSILLPALGVALLAGTSLARAQTVETLITPAPGPTVIAQEPAPVVESVPIQTTETVRTVRSTKPSPRRVARVPAPGTPRADSVTTTQTTVRENIVQAPVAPGVAVIGQPPYAEVVQAPPVPELTYPAPLYDVVPAGAAPPLAVVEQPPIPVYRYVYQPDRILVIDANTGIAVRALPR
jgi:hypothetical protein